MLLLIQQPTFVAFVVLASLLSQIVALQVVPSSPCAAQCKSAEAGTTGDDIVCKDAEYQTVANGTRFQNCVECELSSTHVDAATGDTDVLWGLYNLRYAVSTCVYDFPTTKQSLSTPCQVTCAPIVHAMTLGISDNVTSTHGELDFCTDSAFAEVTVNKCASCFNLTSDERYMSNFFQSLHAACRDPPTSGSSFPITPTTIFSAAAISAPPSSGLPQPHHLPKLLPLMIALPILAFAIILFVCCFFTYTLVRRRRRKAKASGAMQRVHERYLGDWVGMSPTTPGGCLGGGESAVSPASPGAWGGGKAFDLSASPHHTKSFKNATWGQLPSDGNNLPYPSDDKKPPIKVGEQVHEQYFPPPPPGPPPNLAADVGLQYMTPPTHIPVAAQRDFVAPTLAIPQPARMKASWANNTGLSLNDNTATSYPPPPPPPPPSRPPTFGAYQHYQPPEPHEPEEGSVSPQTFVYDHHTDAWVKQQQQQHYDAGTIGLARSPSDDDDDDVPIDSRFARARVD